MNRAAVGSLILLGALLPAPRLFAHSALSVDTNALWRVDLDTQTGESLVDLDAPDPSFGCRHLAVSSTGIVRCALESSLYAIDAATGEVSELPPALPPPPPIPGPPPPASVSGGLTFDASDRLWYLDQAGTVLLQLEPVTGAVLSSQPLSLTGTFAGGLAALEDRLYVLTRSDETILEEIDPATGISLSAVELAVKHPVDAAFDDRGDLWVVSFTPTFPPFICFRVLRISLATSAIEPVSGSCFPTHELVVTNIANVRGTGLEIPTLDTVGRVCLLGLLLLSALIVLRRTGP